MLRKKNFLVVTILILLVFLVTGCSGFLPKPTKGVISGRVLIPPTAKQLSKDISGWVGAAGAEVTIVDANGVKHTVITDENGYYNFENIAVKANTVVTATAKVDGKTMVLKTVIDKTVGKDQKYDSGAMTPESTALAIVVEHIQDVGGIVNLDEIKETDSYLDLLGKVTEVLEAQGNVEDDAGVQDLADEAVDEILYPDDGTPTPPSGGGGGTPPPPKPAFAVEYYTGKGFNRSYSPIVDSSGNVIQTINANGSITITVEDTEYIDSGFVIEAGLLGELGSITVEGIGDYGLNLYFDLDGEEGFFEWDGNTFIDVGGDAYALCHGTTDDGALTVTDATKFNLMGTGGGIHTVAELKAKYGADRKIGIWVGVTSSDGNQKTATISSVTIEEAATTNIPVVYYTGKDFNKSDSPIVDSSGNVVQTINADGSISIEVSGDTNIEAGFVIEAGLLGELGSITVEGSGEYYLNLYFDVSGDGEFFEWNADGTFSGVGTDEWAADGGSSINGNLEVDEATIYESRTDGKNYTVSELKAIYGSNTLVGIWIGVDSIDEIATISSVTIEEAAMTDIPVEYYTGKGFNRSYSPIVDSSGNVIQTINANGSITITVEDTEYIDSGFVIEAGLLGELGSITVEGSGEYGLNLYFDLDDEEGFFEWNGNEYKGVGGDAYATGEEATDGQLTINGESIFWLMVDPQGSYTLSELKERYSNDTPVPVGIWIGVTSMNGSEKIATINSVTIEIEEED